ncbi:MAG: hypothetical protein ACI9HK_006054, partial [Pirellulaceae bacterium]
SWLNDRDVSVDFSANIALREAAFGAAFGVAGKFGIDNVIAPVLGGALRASKAAARRATDIVSGLDALPNVGAPGNATDKITRQQFQSFKESVEALGFKVKLNGNLRRPKSAGGGILQGTTDPSRKLVRINSRHATQQALIDEYAHVFNQVRGRGRFLDDIQGPMHITMGNNAVRFGTRRFTILENLRFHQLELKNFLQSGEAFPSFFDGVSESAMREFTQ